jgi:SLT domain-containing protein
MPNMSGFAKALMAGTNAAASQAGRSAGRAFSATMSEASASDVLKSQVESMRSALQQAERAAVEATRNIAQARDRQKAADQQVQAAEARLAEQVEKYGEGSSRALKAQAQLTTAQGKARKTSDELADATKQVSAASHAKAEADTALTAKQNELNAAESRHPGLLDRVSVANASAAKSTGVFGRALGSARGMVSALGVTVGAYSLVSWVSNSLTAAKDFQKQMNLLVTAGGESQRALGLVADGIKGIAVQTGISTSQLSEGMYTMEKAQMRGADGLKVLKAAAQGATDEQVDLGVMTNALTSIMRSYNIPASNASSVTNQLVAASGEAKTTMQEFAGSLSTVLPVASAAGLSFAQVGGAIATLTSHGTSADEATQELSNTIRALQAPNEVAVKEMQQFGISSVDVAKNLGKNGLTGTIGYLTQMILKNMGPSGTLLLKTFNQSQYAAQDASTMFDRLTGSAKSLAQGVMNGTVTMGDWYKQTQRLPAQQANLAQQWESMYLKSKGFNDQLKSGSPEAQTYTDALKKIMGGATGMNTALMLSGGSTKAFASNVAGISKVAKQNGADIATWAETQNTAQVQTQRFNQTLNVARITMAAKFLPAITSSMRGLTNAAVGIANFTSKHKVLVGVLAGMAGSLVALVVGVRAYIAITKAGTAANMIFTGGMKLLKLAFLDSPWGWVVLGITAVVAAVIYCWNHFKGFRDFILGAFNGIKNAASAVGNWFSGPFVNFFRDAWGKVTGFFSGAFSGIRSGTSAIGNWFSGPFAGFFTGAWNVMKSGAQAFWNFIKMVGNGILNVFRFIITLTATILVTPWVLAWHQMEKPVTWLWHNVVEPAWNGIKTIFSASWNFIKSTVINSWNREIRLIATVFSWLYNNIVRPVWSGMKSIFSASWNWIKSTVINSWNREINGWATIFKWLYSNIVKPVWGNIKNIFSTTWDWIKRVVVDAWNREINGWATIFKWLYDSVILPVWGTIRTAFNTGWGFIRDHVVSPFKTGIHDIGQVFSDTSSWIGRSWDKVKDAAAKPVRWVVNTVYTNGIRSVWNKVAKAVGLNLALPEAPKFAEGGINAGYAPGHDTVLAMTSPGEAWMVPEWTRAVGSENIYRWNRLARQSGPAAVRRDMMGYSAGGVVPRFDAGGIVNAIGGFIGSVASTVSGFIKDPGGSISKWIVDPVKSLLKNIGGGSWGSMIAQFPLKVANGLVGKAKSLWNGMGSSGSSPSAPSVNYTPSSGVAQWSSQVLQALSMLGQPASWLNTVLRRMNQESGGNPNAINNWDSNARAGMPSQGLMQTIPGTFHAYAGPFAGKPITDPLANIYAGLNYAIHRYGSLDALNRPGGYATGGIVPRRLYDTGGVLDRGMTLVENRSGSPELVLNRSQQELLFSKRSGDHDKPVNVEPKQVVQNFDVRNYGMNDPYSHGTIFARTVASQARVSLSGRS